MNNKKLAPLRKALLFCILLAATCSPAVFAVEGREIAEDLDNYFVPAYPLVYSEIIDALPAEEVVNISSALKGVEIFDYIYKIAAIGDSLASGNADMDTALDGATVAANLAIKLMADGTTKKILIAGVGVGTLPLSALVTTIDIARASQNAVTQSKTALDLGRFYHSVEQDPVLKIEGRKLGQGNPLRTDKAAVEHLFRKCLTDSSWSKLFKTYVISELGEDRWPEPSRWDKLTVNSDFLQEAAILKEQQRLKGYMAGLLSELNKLAKRKEARVVVAKQMRALRAMTTKVSPEELRKALSLYRSALKRLPEIREYASSLPGRVEQYRKKLKKASATELQALRGNDIPAEMAKIVGYMSYVKYLPTKGKHADDRKHLLQSFKANYQILFAMKNKVSVAVVNARLEKETAKLTVQNLQFKTTRHPCPKFFEDYLSSFEQDVKAGRKSKKLSKVYTEIEKNLDEVSKAYKEDFKKNEELYNNKRAGLNEQIKELTERLYATDDYSERSRLINAKERLSDQLDKLEENYRKYLEYFETISRIDINQCREVKQEVDQYIEAYRNKFKNIESSLDEYYKNAKALYKNFLTSHGTYTKAAESFVSEQKIGEIEEIINKKPGSVYAYTDLKFLKKLVQSQADKPVSTNIQQSLEAITEALKRTHSQVAQSRLTVRTTWTTWTIPKLQYMESAKSEKDIAVVSDIVEEAIKNFKSVDSDDISTRYKSKYKNSINRLDGIKDSLSHFRKLRSQATGLSGRLSRYVQQANQVNQSVEIDSLYLLGVYEQLMRATHHFKGFLVRFKVRGVDSGRNPQKAPPAISNTEIQNVLEEDGILTFSTKMKLGLEKMLKPPFIELSTDKGIITIKKEHVQSLLAKVSKIPVDNYENYTNKYRDIKKLKGPEGFLMRLTDLDAEFTAMFATTADMKKTAAKILETLQTKKAQISKAQAKLDAYDAKVSFVLGKVMPLLESAENNMSQGFYSSVMDLNIPAENIMNEYKSMDITNNDIDEALRKLTELIGRARKKYIAAQNDVTGGGQEKIGEFYQKFKQAYESRNDYQVMNLISKDWEAGDGTTLHDLEMNLRRTFRVFDEIQYSISNLKISPKSAKTYLVTYDISINSRNFSRNFKHEEKSSVREEVGVDANGNVKIIRTLSGRFWQK